MNKEQSKKKYEEEGNRHALTMLILILLFSMLGVFSSSCATHSAQAYDSHRGCAAYR
jgi:hypothetical protein